MASPHFVISLTFLFSLSGTRALQCYDCSYLAASSSNSLANTVLSTINHFSDSACKMESEGDQNTVDINNCAAPAQGNLAKCAEIKGTIDTTVLVFDVRIQTVTRNCIEVGAEDSSYTDGCHDDLPSTAQNLFKSFLSAVSLGEIHFTGQACYSTSDLSSGIRSATVSYAVVAFLAFLAYTRFGLV